MSQTCTGVAGVAINASCTVPSDGDLVNGAGLLAACQSLENDLKTIRGGVWATTAKIVGADPCELRGIFKADTTGPTTKFTGFSYEYDSASNVKLLGRKGFLRPRVALPGNADRSIDVSQGDRFTLPAVLTPRIITLVDVAIVPQPNETMTVIWMPGAPGGGTQITFKRENGTTIALFVGPTGTATNAGLFSYVAEFEYSGGLWKLGQNSGVFYDNAGPIYVGVLGVAGI